MERSSPSLGKIVNFYQNYHNLSQSNPHQFNTVRDGNENDKIKQIEVALHQIKGHLKVKDNILTKFLLEMNSKT